MNSGFEPSDGISFNLNEYLTFRMKNKSEMSLTFSSGAIKHTFELSAKEKRSKPSYLKNAARSTNGRLKLIMETVTLRERQTRFNETMKALRNKVHPKSENLSDMVRNIVQGLENSFDGIAVSMATSPGAGSQWKSSAFSTTVSELPRITFSGTETGTASGFGEHIYTASLASSDLSKTVRDSVYL
jgi:hypothetical protein